MNYAELDHGGVGIFLCMKSRFGMNFDIRQRDFQIVKENVAENCEIEILLKKSVKSEKFSLIFMWLLFENIILNGNF